MSEPKSLRELRKFAWVMTAALALIASLLMWRRNPSSPYIGSLAGIILALGLFWPRALSPLEWAWMKLAHILGAIMTRIIVVVSFYLIITPMGLLLRLFGKDLLNMKYDKAAPSYWEPVDPNGPCNRPDQPY